MSTLRRYLLVAVGVFVLGVVTAGSGRCQAAPQPLSLEQAIAAGLANNPLVAEAGQNLDIAKQVVTQAKAGNSVVASVQMTRTHLSDVSNLTLPVPGPGGTIDWQTFAFSLKDSTTGTATVAKPLYTGGAVQAAVRQSRAGERASAEQLLRTRQTVVNNIKRAYYGVLVTASLVQVADQAVSSAKENLRLAQARFDAGTAPRFDVLTADTRLADSQQALISARNGLNLARAALNNAMGLPQDMEYELTSDFVRVAAPVPALPELVAQAEANRPEMRQTAAEIAAAGAAADLARSQKRPTLSAAWVYTYPFESGGLSARSWTLAATAALTIFDGKQTSAAVSQAEIGRAAAGSRREQLRQGIALQVRQAYLDINSASERVVAATTGVTGAEEAYRIAKVRYEAGVGIGLEVDNAQVAWTQARTQYAQAVYDYSVALAQLEYVIAADQPNPAAAPAAAAQ